jgi:quinoprotein glucose dehydrogenase
MDRHYRIASLIPLATFGFALTFSANAAPPKSDYNPPVAKASDEAEKAMARFKYDKALRVSVWAAEPLLANPVAFSFDEKGRCFVAETFRLHHGVTDTRGHMHWLDDDMACRTVADRVAMYKQHAKEKFTQTYEKDRDRIRLLEDTTGAGKADKATVFRDDFGRAEDGLGAGVLARHGSVYYTCIPDLYLLKDTTGTGTADVKQSLASGFGVHVNFIGHDLHGLRMGPDGRLYFSIGDRGINVTTKEGKHLFYPDTGAVLRCDPDGSSLEVVHFGLRNPQELAFDDWGNLFTVDNNSDSGDQARWVYITEGGDSGWRTGYQYGSAMGNRGPWNAEKLWHTPHEGQPAYIVPPLKHFTAGPSGFCYYPGVGLSQRYDRHFFVVDFRGSAGSSGIWSFAAWPKGASFEMVDEHQFLWGVLATDCDFGPDGCFYLSDWVEGWNTTGKGRIYKVTDPEAQKVFVVPGAKKLLAEGFDQRPLAELDGLLQYPHQQVRLEAQWALVARAKPGQPRAEIIRIFAKELSDSQAQFARLHSLWGLTMIRPAEPAAVEALVRALKTEDPEVRAQAARALGDLLSGPLAPGISPEQAVGVLRELLPLLGDPQPRVRYLAAMGLQKLGHLAGANKQAAGEALAAARKLIRENADQDPYLRHAGVMVLAAFGPEAVALTGQPLLEATPSERLATVLAYRRQAGRRNVTAALARFLLDSDPKVVAEAARAIHDENIAEALPQLAGLTEKLDLSDPVLYRALNAHFRLGHKENVAALAEFAAREGAPEALRVLALKMLGDWAKPPRRDYVTGLTQNLPPRTAEEAAAVLRGVLAKVFVAPTKVRQEAATVAGKLGVAESAPFLLTLLHDTKQPADARIEALRALEAIKSDHLSEAIQAAISSSDSKLRHAGRTILLRVNPDELLKQLAGVLDKGDVRERQGAFALLAAMKSPAADQVLSQWLSKLLNGQAPPEIMLDLLEAAKERAKASNDPARLGAKLRQYEVTRPKNDDLAAFRESLAGGDADNGRHIFLTHAAASCQRCHKLDGEGGEVGPPLDGIGAKQKRDYLLESLVLPNKQIAKGYDSIIVTLLDGKSVSGVLRGEDAKQLTLITPEGHSIQVVKDDIDTRRPTKSAMPDDLTQKLSKSEIRDLVEFLVSLKEEPKKKP